MGIATSNDSAVALLPASDLAPKKPTFFQRLATMPKVKAPAYKVPVVELKKVVKLLEKEGKVVTVTVLPTGGFSVTAVDPAAAPEELDEWAERLANGKA